MVYYLSRILVSNLSSFFLVFFWRSGWLAYWAPVFSGNVPEVKSGELLYLARVRDDVTELRSFIGLINYYAKFLPDLASTMAPLYLLLHRRSDGHGPRHKTWLLNVLSSCCLHRMYWFIMTTVYHWFWRVMFLHMEWEPFCLTRCQMSLRNQLLSLEIANKNWKKVFSTW